MNDVMSLRVKEFVQTAHKPYLLKVCQGGGAGGSRLSNKWQNMNDVIYGRLSGNKEWKQI